jgi:enterobacterial common antigen flippase
MKDILSKLKRKSSLALVLQTLVSKFSILGMGLITSVINARLLGPDGRGEQAAMLTVAATAASLATLGIPVSLVYNFKRYPAAKSNILGLSILITLTASICSAVLGATLIPSWLLRYPEHTVKVAQLFMLSVPLSTLSFVGWAALEAEEDFHLVNILRPMTLVLTILMMLTYIKLDFFTPLTSALSYLLPNMIVSITIVPRILSKIRPSFRSSGIGINLLSYGFKAYGNDLLITLSGQLDQLLVLAYLSPSSMGEYVIGLSLSRIVGIFQQSVVMIIFPKLAALSLQEVIERVGLSARLGIIVIFAAGLIGFFIGPLFLVLLYGQQFQQIIPTFRVLIIEVIISGWIQLLVQAFLAVGRPELVTSAQALGLIAVFPCMIILIPKLGTLGAALSLLVSSIVKLGAVISFFPVFLNVRPPKLTFQREDIYEIKKLMMSFLNS